MGLVGQPGYEEFRGFRLVGERPTGVFRVQGSGTSAPASEGMLASVDTPNQTSGPKWLPEELNPVALRLARADDCAFKIGDLTSKWSLDGPLDFEQVRRGNTVQMVLKSLRPVPAEASLLFSEAINHLRAAIDNVIWYVVDQEHGQLEGIAATLVNMPILESQEKLDGWTKRRVKDKISALGAETQLGRRIRALQPFVDVQSGIPSMGKALALIMGQEVERAHPLRLLQGYSNADKHRSIRIAIPRTFSSNDSSPLASQHLAHQDLPLGPPTTWGKLAVVETNTAAMVQRPAPFAAWVNPVKEINAIRRHVAQVVVPILLTGLEMPNALPPSIGLGDNGQTDGERIAAGVWDDAEKRLQPALQARYQEAESRDLQFIPVIEETEPMDDGKPV